MPLRPLLTIAAPFAAGLAFTVPATAACNVEADTAAEMTEHQITAFYDCMQSVMIEGYTTGDNDVARAYRDWTVTSTRPAVAGAHGSRFLQTFANDVAADDYLTFASEGVDMPAGSVLAKESFSLKDGAGVVGPLFIMTKLGDGDSPETGDWAYSAVTPAGAMMGVSQSSCHDCHVAWEGQDMLAYPLDEVRVSN